MNIFNMIDKFNSFRQNTVQSDIVHTYLSYEPIVFKNFTRFLAT